MYTKNLKTTSKKHFCKGFTVHVYLLVTNRYVTVSDALTLDMNRFHLLCITVFLCFHGCSKVVLHYQNLVRLRGSMALIALISHGCSFF